MSFKYDPEDERPEDEQRASYIRSLPHHHPERVLAEAEQMPWKPTAKFDLGQYGTAIHSLRERGYSFAEVANWLVEKTGIQSINRGHVYRAYQSYRDAEEARFQRDVDAGKYDMVTLPNRPYLHDDEAERQAAAADSENTKNNANKPR